MQQAIARSPAFLLPSLATGFCKNAPGWGQGAFCTGFGVDEVMQMLKGNGHGLRFTKDESRSGYSSITQRLLMTVCGR
ncbi:hypothetical protein [Almyronema epifaneia]|uniref:Uncharacterized protein n=1 Tax=Almyronema epifaneia S1 TaxID=2991925 RepID=A0ABW6IIZ4_9CYAN